MIDITKPRNRPAKNKLCLLLVYSISKPLLDCKYLLKVIFMLYKLSKLASLS